MTTPFDQLWNIFMLKRRRVSYGKNLRINGRVHIHGVSGRIQIGDNCVINSDEDANPTAGGEHSHLVAGTEGKIFIGNNVGMSLVYITSLNKVEIQDNVLIGANTKIWDTDFHPIDYQERMEHKDARTAPVLIKEGAFVGSSSIILKGVTIGAHSVIGAGSVVTKNVPDNEIWAGNPAKFVRRIED